MHRCVLVIGLALGELHGLLALERFPFLVHNNRNRNVLIVLVLNDNLRKWGVVGKGLKKKTSGACTDKAIEIGVKARSWQSIVHDFIHSS